MAYNDLEIYKVYLIYLKTEKIPYAFTINKDFKDIFLYQRNKDLFYVKKVKMNEIEYSAFLSVNHRHELVEIPLNTSLTDYEMIFATYDEESKLTEEADKLDRELDEIYRRLVLQTYLKTKYTDSIEYLCTKSFINDKKEHLSTINLFALFLKLFENTFKKIEENEYEDVQ